MNDCENITRSDAQNSGCTPIALGLVTSLLHSCAWPIQAHDWSREVTWSKAILVHPLFCASLLAMFSQSFNPFLYFQF